MTPESLDYAITRYGVVLGGDNPGGWTPYLPAFLAGWYARIVMAKQPARDDVGQFYTSWLAGWREADGAVRVSDRNRPDLKPVRP